MPNLELQRLGRCLGKRVASEIPVCRASQEVPGQILHPDHFRDQEEVDNRADEENPACQQPDKAGHPPSEIKPVQSEHTEPAKEPQKVGHEVVFHSNSLGSGAFGFQSKGRFGIDLVP